MSENKEFSILSLNIRANTSSDLEPHLTRLREMDDVEIVRLGGNSLGVEACEELAKVLKDKKSLKVSVTGWVGVGRWELSRVAWRWNNRCCGRRVSVFALVLWQKEADRPILPDEL
jgi:hypothetical protein